MFEQLQDALDEFEQQREVLESLQLKLLERSCELDHAHTKIQSLERKLLRSEVDPAETDHKLSEQLKQSKIRISNLEEEVKSLKGSSNPKKLKEQIARLKEKNKALTKGNGLLKIQSQDYRKEMNGLRKDLKNQLITRTQLAMTHAYTDSGHELWMIPTKLGIDRGKGVERIIALLHLAPNGIGYLVTVMNGEINLDEEVAGRGLPAMPKRMYAHAEKWLSKVESQHYNVTEQDLMTIGGFTDLDGDR
ncbi:hypothetical protein JCM19235_5116 [Vibrio maritimus]|uniref:Uncharacterized protein n=2 Tax=Vibrio TaxID=662 RepID=A0A090SAI7_9VIBR|nr:hypothetical protein JCM19235_5116 [Vibrio maritimus]